MRETCWPAPLRGVTTALRHGGQRVLRFSRRLHRDRRGATMLEWTLLLAVIALPSYVIFTILLDTLVIHYRMMVMLNHLPFP